MATTTLTTNTDIDYIQKDANSSEDAMISFANVNFGPGTSSNRLWTDFNQDSFSRNWLSIVSFIADVFFFYLDVQSTQSYLQTATVPSAIANIAAQFGFTLATASSASGDVTFTVTGAGTIPRGFKVSSASGVPFYLTTPIVTSGAGTYTGTVLQGSFKSQQFTAAGIENEEFNLVGPNVVVDLNNINSLDISPQVTVNGNSYTLVSTFINSNGTDTAAVIDSFGNVVGGGGRVFQLGTRPSGTPFIEFGDGTFGRKLSVGETVAISYRSGGGTTGNVGEKTVTSLVDTNPIVSSVTNAAKFSGGSDAQTIDKLRSLIPASLRTLERAVTLQDYSDLLLANFTQVQAASAEINTNTLGIDINVYVVPSGATITPISTNTNLKTTLTNFLDLRKMVTVQFQILDAFGVNALIALEVHISNTSSQTTIKQNIVAALENFFSLTTGGTSGTGVGFATEVLLEDISSLLKTIQGIERFEIRKFTYSPRVDKEVVGLTTSYDVSDVTIFPTVTEREWLVGASGPVTESTGTLLVHNNNNAPFTYNHVTGLIQYTSSILPETLNAVAPGDLFRDGASTDFTILGVDSKNTNLYIAAGLDEYTFTVSSANATAGAVYTNNGQNFTVNSTIVAGTTLSCTITTNGVPTSSGTLTKFSGTGDATITFSAETGQTVNTTHSVNGGGSIREGASAHESFKVFKKILATATNLSVNSITDTNLDLSVDSGTGVNLAPNILLDNTQTFILNQYSTGNYYLVDAASNIWEITANDSDTLTMGLTAVNDASISTVTAGNYKIVIKLTSYQAIFNDNIFTINYNTHNTIFSIGAQFSNIGTIGNSFQLSLTQNNVGNLGVALNLISYNPSTGLIQLNNQPDLSGINSNDFMIDSSGQIFRITAVDNRLEPSIAYDQTHFNNSVILSGTITNSKLAQGFKVPTTATYPTVSWYLKKEGNIAGNLVVQIVNDLAGLPNLSSVVATANTIPAASLPETFTKTTFVFSTPPTLTASTQYHLVISGDTGYNTIQKNNVVVFNNDSAATAYTYNFVSGVIQYGAPVGLYSVLPGNFIKDKAGNLFKILAVDVSGFTVTIAPAAIFVDDSPFSATAGSGSIYAKDNVYIGLDTVSHTYPDGVFETYNGTLWTDYSPTADAIFSVEGPKTITVNSNLTPILGPGATVSSRYYDDNNEISFILGISSGIDTAATDVNAIGRGTVASVSNSKVDTFIFRTSPYIDDILNLRADEIPQITSSDIVINIFDGVS